MSLISKPTKVHLEGHGALTLRPVDYMTGGGEGAIYKKDSTIIKLYLDPKKMERDDMTSKVRLLAKRLVHPSIVAPRGVVTNDTGTTIGYHMPFVSGEALPRIFTNDWRTQNHFGDTETVTLTAGMHDVVKYTHTAGALLVDGNELNWLADVTDIRKPVPYAIDVDSWQIDRFKATVMMPSIRDWHTTGITTESDWFAWGIVSFLLFTGIHPFKGTLAGYKPGELERRMKDHASVFNPNVRLNKAVRDFAAIPGPLFEWYRETFSGNTRTMPPSPLLTGAVQTAIGRIMRVVATTTGGLVYEKLFEKTGDAVVSVWPCGVVRLASGALVELTGKRTVGQTTGTKVAVVATTDGWLIAEELSHAWHWRFINRVTLVETPLSLAVPVVQVVRSGERLFVVTETELIELALHQFGKPVLTLGNRWHVLKTGTRWFGGMDVADVIGAMHIVSPYGTDAVALVRTSELDGLTVVNALAGNRFAEVVTVNKNGDYEAHTFAFTSDWKQYRYTKTRVDGPEQNLTILPKGVTARIVEDSELIIMVPGSGDTKVVKDKDLATDMRLSHIGNQVVYRKDGTLWSLRMQ